MRGLLSPTGWWRPRASAARGWSTTPPSPRTARGPGRPAPDPFPQGALHPCDETLLAFHGTAKAVSLEAPPAPTRETVILGVRSCDARALTRLDDVFLKRKETDSLYGNRRKTTRLVGLACESPSWGCFCTSVGGSPAASEGLDLLFTDLGDRYHIAILSEAGRELIAGAGFAAATDADASAAKAQHAAAVDRMPPFFDAKAVAEKVEWDAPVWMHYAGAAWPAAPAPSSARPATASTSRTRDSRPTAAVRFRCWDTCQFGEFTLHERPATIRGRRQTERVRQRVVHKFKYLVEAFGRHGLHRLRSVCASCAR